MIRAEEVLCALMRGREYQNDPVVRQGVDWWRLGRTDAGRVLFELVRALSAENRRLVDAATRAAWLSPMLVPLDGDTPIRGVPPATAPGERRCVPLSEAMPGDQVYVTEAGELVAKQPADVRAAWNALRDGLRLKPAADAPIITGAIK